jgi:hypothetical protein
VNRTEQKKMLTSRWIEEVMHRKNLAAVDELFTTNLVDHSEKSRTRKPLPIGEAEKCSGEQGERQRLLFLNRRKPGEDNQPQEP